MNVELYGPVLNLHSRQIQFQTDKTDARAEEWPAHFHSYDSLLSVIVPVARLSEQVWSIEVRDDERGWMLPSFWLTVNGGWRFHRSVNFCSNFSFFFFLSKSEILFAKRKIQAWYKDRRIFFWKRINSEKRFLGYLVFLSYIFLEWVLFWEQRSSLKEILGEELILVGNLWIGEFHEDVCEYWGD